MLPMLGLILGGMCLSLTPGDNHNNSNRSSNRYPENMRPGVSEENNESQRPRDRATGREEIAYLDELDEDIHHRANRKGDWDYKQNWRYDRKAFYKGETQGEAYDREHADGVGGPGMDPDTEYLEMHKFYLKERNRQNTGNQKKDAARPYANSQNHNNREVSNQSDSYARPAYPSGNRNSNNCYPTNGYDYR